MYAGKNKSKNSKARSIATSEESLKLSSTDSRYDAGDYEAVPASIRKVRDARRREQQEKYEEENALPASEIIAQQEAEIARLKQQVEQNSQPQTMADKYRSALDDGEHPTFKNPESMADFGDYEAVAASARPGAESRDPDQKVFRAKPAVKTRQIAKPSDLSDGSYEAVAAGARHSAPSADPEPDEEPEINAAPVTEEPSFSREVPEYTAPSEPEYEEPEYTAPAPEPEPEPQPAPRPAPAPVSAADYTVQAYEEKEAQPAPAPAPVSAADYTVSSYTVNEPEPAQPAVSSSDYIHRETYTPPAARTASTSPSGSGYIHSEPYVPPAQRDGGSSFPRQSSHNIASVADLAPGDYEAVAVSSFDDSDMDYADGSYDFDKYLANAPTLQMHAEPEISPEELAWQDLSDDTAADEEPDITDEQTRALAEALAQETLSNQPGMQFEDIIDNVIAKVMEKKKAEDAAKASQKAEEAKPEEPQKAPEQEKPEQSPAPQEPQKVPEPQPEEPEPQPIPVKHSLEPDCIPDDTPIDDIPALIVAELDSINGEVTDDDIHKTIDAILISRLTRGELTLDSVQSARSSIMSEIKEMQEEEARILAELSGEKHEFRTDFLPHDIALEDIPDAVIAELDKVKDEVPDDDVKKAVDTVLIAKLADGELTLDSYQSSRDDIFEALGIEQSETEEPSEPETEEEPEEAPVEEPEPESEEETEPEIEEESEEATAEEPEETPAEKPETEEILVEETETAEEPEPEADEEPEETPAEEPVKELEEAEGKENITIDTEDVEYTIETPEPDTEPEQETEVSPEETVEEAVSSEEENIEEEEEEAEEETTGIPVPKEPTVLEYDPYADKFVNPEPEPLSAAAVIAMQNQDEEPESEQEPEPEEGPEPEIIEEPESEPEEPVVSPVEESEPEVQAEPDIEEKPEEVTAEQSEEVSVEEPEEEPEPEIEEEPEEAAAEEPETSDESVGLQITFDDIFRNPFVNDFEPLETEVVKEPEPEEEESEPEVESDQAVETEPAEGPETVEEDEPEPVDVQPEADTEIEEKIEIDDIFEASEEDTPVDDHTEEPVAEDDSAAEQPADDADEKAADDTGERAAEEAAEAAKKAEEEAHAQAEAEARARTEENLQKYGVDFVSEENNPDEQEEYSEAKALRHEAMQNALLMAMVDGSDSSFCDTLNKLMEKGNLNARTLRSRMPIDSEELNKVLNDPDYKPDKKTAIAICFALRLTWEDSVRLLYKAGHVLSDASRYDLTIEYLLRRGVYDQNMINSVLRGSGLDGFGTPRSEI